MPRGLWVVVLCSAGCPEAPKPEQEPQQESQQRLSTPQSRFSDESTPGSRLWHRDETGTPRRIPGYGPPNYLDADAPGEESGAESRACGALTLIPAMAKTRTSFVLFHVCSKPLCPIVVSESFFASVPNFLSHIRSLCIFVLPLLFWSTTLVPRFDLFPIVLFFPLPPSSSLLFRRAISDGTQWEEVVG